MPFSYEIMSVVVPPGLVGVKATFTGVEDPETHLTAFHTQMMLSRGLRCCVLQAVHEHPERDYSGVVREPTRWPHHFVSAVLQVVHGAVYREQGTPSGVV